ncbi:MAG: hypothetical protein V1704_03915 [Candidatus Vogelbacteria bacterium]
MKKRGVLQGLVFGTPAYVEAHARYKAKRGKNPSFTTSKIKNPKRALALAQQGGAVDDWVGCGRMEIDEHLSKSYVRQNGRILPWGCIRILDLRVHDPDDDSSGLECWSEKMLPYGTGEFYAQIDSTSPTVIVCSRTDGQKVVSIPFTDFYGCDVRTSVVAPNGYLINAGSGGRRYKDLPDDVCKENENLITALSTALAGKMPRICDNSCFVRVSPRYAGEEVVCIYTGLLPRYVLSMGGTVIKSQVHQPLAVRRWRERLAG